MKMNFKKGRGNRFLLLTIIFFLFTQDHSFAQVLVGFTQRTSINTPTKVIYSIRGDYTMIGNTNLTVSPYGVNTDNSNNTSVYVDIDGDPNTFNSSSATLGFSTENGAVPSCSNIIYAGLYWTGRCSDASTSPETFSVTKGGITKQFDKRVVSLKGPGQTSYTKLTANAGNIYYPTSSDGLMYSAYTEVTDYVKANGLGEYFVADMALIEGNGGGTGYYGGWGMIVVYENSKMNWRDVTIFDGHAYVKGNATINYELPVSGFTTAKNGQINLKLGVMAGEGDVGISGDYFKIRNYQNNAWIALNDSANGVNNFFNSSIVTGGNARNPNLKNNTGMDLHMFDIPNSGNSIITNNQTSTIFQYGYTQDTYIIFCIAMSVDAYVPDVAFLVSTQSINGQPVGSGSLTVQPGQDIAYKLEIKNQGTENIDSARFAIPIPYTTTYVNGSISTTVNISPLPTPNHAYFDSTYGATGAVIWNIGTIPRIAGKPDSLLAELTFHLKVIQDCNILKNPDCPPIVTLAGGVISGKGDISGISFSNQPFIQGYDTSGACIGQPINSPIKINIDATNYLATNCKNTPSQRKFVFCNYTAPTIPVDSILSHFPAGLRFYNTNKVTATSIEYDVDNPFPATLGTSTYFAIPDSAGLCYYTFSIVVSNIVSTPAVTDVIYCLNAVASPLTAIATDTSYTLYYYDSLTSTTPKSSITPITTSVGVKKYYAAQGVAGECISPNKAAITVTVYDMSASINTSSQVNVLCKGASTGVASVIANGGSGSYSYSWSTTPVQTTSTAISLSAGTYTATVSDNNGCVVPVSSVATITEPTYSLSATINSATQVNVLCKGANTGSAEVTVNGGSGRYSYLWNTTPAQIGSTAINLAAGSYTVTVLDSNGCTVPAIAIATITEPSFSLSASINSATQVNVVCKGASTGSAAVIATGGSGKYSYSWNSTPVQTTSTAVGLAAGSYTVTVADSNGCVVPAIAVATITEPTYSLSASINTSTQVNVLCKGASTGVASVIANGGSGSYSYSWSTTPVQTTSTAIGLSAGTYTATVSDNNGCVVPVSSVATITEPTYSLSATINSVTQVNVLCKGANTGSAEVVVIGGSGKYSYLWNTIPAQIGSTAINLSAGSYTVTVLDSNGCTVPVIAIATITEPTYSLSATINSATQVNVVCKGASTGSAAVIATGGSGKYSYSWNSTPVQTTSTAVGLAAGSYTVAVADNNGCVVPAIAVATIAEPTYSLSASINTSTQVNVLCKDASTGVASVIANGGSGGYSYTWSTTPVQTTSTATGLAAGTYTATVSDNNGCIVPVTAVATITEPTAVLSASITAQTNVYCKYGNTGSATVTAAGGSGSYSYLWNDELSQTTTTASTLTARNYIVTISDNNGCLVPATVTVTITEPTAVLTASITSKTDVSCKNGNTGMATVTAMGGSGVYSYQWNDASFQTTAIVSGLTAGNYTVTVFDNNRCVTPVLEVVAITEPTYSLSASINFGTQVNVLCKGSSTGAATVVASGGSGNYSYSWSTTPIQTTAIAIGLAAGTYTATVSDDNGCVIPVTAVATIIEPAAVLSASITAHADVYCKYDNTGSAEVVTTGGSGSYSYLWNTTPAQIGSTAINLSAGNYTVTVLDSNGCTVPAIAIATITEPTYSLSATINSSTQVNVLCKGTSTGSAEVIPSGGSGNYSYSWNTNPVQTTATASGLAVGSYTVTLLDNNGCNVPVTVVATITEPTYSLNVAINTESQVNVSCHGGNNGSVGVFVTGGSEQYTYVWSTTPVQTTAIANGLAAGTYTVNVSDKNGCSISTSAVGIINDPQALNVVSAITHSICNKSTGSVILNVSGGTQPYIYLWSNGSTEQNLLGLNGGSYSVKVTDNNGCTISNTADVTQTYLTISVSSPIYQGGHNLSGYKSGDGSIDLSVNGVASPYTYNWSTGATTKDVSGLQAGVYTIVVTDAEGCSAFESISIDEPLNFEMPTGISPNGDGKNDFFVIHGIEISSSNHLIVFNRWGNKVYETNDYKNDWNGKSFNGEALAEGTYFVIFEIIDKNIVLKGYVDILR